MRGDRLKNLLVLVTGLGAPISCDVVRLLVADDAMVTAADPDAAVLARLQRDLGLARTTVNTALVDLTSYTEMRLFAENLQSLDALPHVIVCCCDGRACPANLAVSVLQPSLVAHALPIARWRLTEAVDALCVPNLAHLLDQRRRRGMRDFRKGSRRVRIAGHIFSAGPCSAPPEPALSQDASSASAPPLRLVEQEPCDRRRVSATPHLRLLSTWRRATEATQ